MQNNKNYIYVKGITRITLMLTTLQTLHYLYRITLCKKMDTNYIYVEDLTGITFMSRKY